uniref:Uncharacterized protein n=1 Tax=Graphocephala atropunctata TaxID=36148 RepID=A0A1B6MJV6_9HEMI
MLVSTPCGHPFCMENLCSMLMTRLSVSETTHKKVWNNKPLLIPTIYCVQYFNSLNLQTNSSKSNVLYFALRSLDSQCGPAVMLADSILEDSISTPQNSLEYSSIEG